MIGIEYLAEREGFYYRRYGKPRLYLHLHDNTLCLCGLQAYSILGHSLCSRQNLCCTPIFLTKRYHPVSPFLPRLQVSLALMRHSEIRTTMNIYGDVVTEALSKI